MCSNIQEYNTPTKECHLGRPGAPDVSPAPQTVSYLVPYKHFRYQSNVNGYVNQCQLLGTPVNNTFSLVAPVSLCFSP